MGFALAALLLLALAVLMLTTTRRTGYLDPGAVDPSGSRAVANILGDLGVRVADVRTTEAATGAVDAAAGAGGAAVLITEPSLLTPAMLERIIDVGPERLILVAPLPGTPALDRLAAGTGLAAGSDLPAGADSGGGDGGAGDEPVDPRCRLPEAVRAGDAQLPGLRYDARAWAEAGEACYDRPQSAALLVIPPRAGVPEVVVLGSAHPLTNEGLDDRGNAALALGLLGSHEDLVWWRPDPRDPALAGRSATLLELVPAWVVPVLAQVLVAFLLVAWWRGRRLGRIAVESLPVVVPAGETTAGHARLLHAHRARAEAAVHLRARARERTRSRLGLAPEVGEGRLVSGRRNPQLAPARAGRRAPVRS